MAAILDFGWDYTDLKRQRQDLFQDFIIHYENDFDKVKVTHPRVVY
jgi:hypothetical protein